MFINVDKFTDVKQPFQTASSTFVSTNFQTNVEVNDETI